MAGLVELLSSYVPLVVQRRFERDPRPLQAPEVHRYRGSLLFLDISGFTALTESLAHEGREGTEKLTRILSSYFDRLIAMVTDYGGDVLKLSGDSVVALWEADEDYGLAGAAMRAAECGLAARQAAAEAAADCDQRLELRGAIGVGEVGTMFVGGAFDRWELLVVGEVVAQIAAASRAASPGQLAASKETWPFLEGRFAGRPVADGCIEVMAASRVLGPQRRPPPVLRDDAQQALLTCLPEGVKARLLAGHSGWLAELRRVSVIFVNLPDWDESALSVFKRTQVVMSALQRIVYQFEGSINKLTVDDKGVTMLAVLGLPPLAHEDDPVRAVRCALAIQAKLRELSVRSAIGVATGHVYCGSVGTEQRREYTVIGGVVNLAARLMQAAPGDVLCDEATQAAASGHIRFEPLPPLTVKGRPAPLTVFRPFSRLLADRAERPMFGRSSEYDALRARLDTLAEGTGARVVIEADAGMGKSRLITELRREAGTRAIPTYLAAGNSIERVSAFHAWRPVFCALFGVDDDAAGNGDADSLRRAVLDRFQDPELRQLAPLLNAVLPCDLPETDLTRGMSGGTRAENTRDLLLRILQDEAGRAPLLLVIEDAHWMDSASLAFASHVAKRLRSALLVITTRPLIEPLTAEQRELLAVTEERFRLEPLSDTETLRLVAQRLGVRNIPPSVAHLITSRAQGNPFFSEELAYALRDAGVVRVVAGECVVPPEIDLEAVTVPNSVEGVVTGRMDRLSAGQQLTLKVASVIGRVFAFRILRDVHPIEPERPRLAEHLAVFTQSDLAALEPSEPDLSYAFKHAITQEVAYNLMLFTQRRQLHKAVADWYAGTFTADLRPYYPVLAYHYKRAEEPAAALHFADLAAREAARQGAYRESIDFLRDALAFDRQAGDAQPAAALRRARWEAALADAHIGLGEVTDSRAHTLNALALLDSPAPRTAGSQVLAIAAEVLVQALHACRPAAFQLKTREQRERAEVAALASERLGHLSYFEADLLVGLHAAVRCVNLAEHSGAPAVLGRAYADMAMALMVLGFSRGAERYCRKAEALLDRIADEPARAWTLQLVGMYGATMAQWARGRKHLQQAIDLAERRRDFRRQEESTIQHALLSYQAAEFADGLQRAQRVRDLTERRGHVQEYLWSTQLVAISLSRVGRVEEASDISNRVSPEQIQQMGRTEQIWQYGAHALCHGRAGRRHQSLRAAELGVAALRKAHPLVTFDVEGSASLVESLIGLAATESDPSAKAHLLSMADQAMPYLRAAARVLAVAAPRSLVWRGALAHLKGGHRAAAAHWHKALHVSMTMAMPYETGLAHLHLAKLNGDLPEGERHAAAAMATFTALGATFDVARAQAVSP